MESRNAIQAAPRAALLFAAVLGLGAARGLSAQVVPAQAVPAPSPAASAADLAIPLDEEALFGDSVLKDYDPAAQAAEAAKAAALGQAGGAASGASQPSSLWRLGGTGTSAQAGGAWRLIGPDAGPAASTGTVGTTLYLDARPDERSRFYLETSSSYGKDSGFSAAVNEAFAEYAVPGMFRLRAGKQRVAWGVGTYFSPADILSLEAIDPEDPAKKRAGPFAAKLDIPRGIQNATVYALLPPDAEIDALALAPRVEFLLGGFEAALAGYGRFDGLVRPRLIGMATGALGDFDVYAESALSWGADRTWIGLSESGSLEFSRRLEGVFAQLTAGFSWSWTHPEQTMSLSVKGQYYYNGQGYAEASLLRERASALNARVAAGRLLASDLRTTGMHYAALSLGMGKLFEDRLSLGLSAFSNLSEPSARLSGTATYKPDPLVSLRAGLSLSLGEEKSEYASRGLAATPSLRLSYREQVSLECSLPAEYAGDLSSGYTLDSLALKLSLGLSVPAF